MFNSSKYWESRYASGGTSGSGSYNKLADLKADFINHFIHKYNIRDMVDFGCGDGNQLALFRVPCYFGLDVSETVIRRLGSKYANDTTKSFHLLNNDLQPEHFDLAISLDVLFHLVEYDVFISYLQQLLAASDQYVIIYAFDSDDPKYNAPHFKARKFTEHIRVNFPQWNLMQIGKNKYPYTGDEQTGSLSDFYVYEKL